MAYGMGYGYPFLAGKAGGAVSPFIDAAAAYSLRDLGLGATNVVRVRRSSDNTEQDFTAAQITGGGLLAFCGSGDGFVSTWYDQSGNARNATQGTALTQPKIVDSGTVVLENGKAAIQFAGSQNLFNSVIVNTNSNTAILVSNKPLVTGARFPYNYAGDRMFTFVDSLRVASFNQQAVIPGTLFNAQTLDIASYNSNGSHRQNGQQVLSGFNFIPLNGSGIISIGSFDSTQLFFTGKIQETIYFACSKTAEMQTLEDNINGFYNIY